MALLDEGETDWKVIVVDVQDSLASKLNDIEDVERNLPGLIRATNEWFRYLIHILTICIWSLIPEIKDLQDPRWQARKCFRLFRRGQEQEICNRNYS
jgi:inorganic pyrophosphatase